MGFNTVPLLCTQEMAVPGLAAACRSACSCTSTRDEAHEVRARLPRRGAPPAAGHRGRAIGCCARWRSSSTPASATSRRTRQPTATRSAITSRCWPPTSRPRPRCPEVVEAAQRAVAGANRYPDPSERRCCAARLSDRYGVPGVAHRARQRLVRDPARRRRGAAGARAPSSSTRGRRSRSTRTWRRRPARARSRSRSTTATSTTSTRCAAEITAATRLVIVCNPNNPTSTALPFERIAAFVEQVPRARRA